MFIVVMFLPFYSILGPVPIYIFKKKVVFKGDLENSPHMLFSSGIRNAPDTRVRNVSEK